ncbi:NGFI-A-binding-like protein [Aphelenchoides avenae]|nr:NGFI-A-binding-like protein [Aphelenchus avenae]
MRKATTLSEWQLQAVLFKAKLTQYYDTFISQGGDDIDQIMQCDEQEFLEIMSLVGMSSKPLHVRRLQRTLNEFSVNRAQFLQNAVPFIGLPPVDLPSSSATDNVTAALQFLIPGFLPGQIEVPGGVGTSGMASGETTPSGAAHSRAVNVATSPITLPAPVTSSVAAGSLASTSSIFSLGSLASTSSIGGTANVLPLPDNLLIGLMASSASPSSTSTVPSFAGLPFSMASLGAGLHSRPSTSSPANSTEGVDMQPTTSKDSSDSGNPLSQLFETPTLTDADVAKLAKFAREIMEQFPQIEPRMVQNKKKISSDLLDAMNLPVDHPSRLQEFRKFSAIYGRFDAKRKPDKALTFHEVLVNEAAAHICLIQPSLLTRRDELFPLARKVVRLAGFPGLKTHSSRREEDRKRGFESRSSDLSHSPRSSLSNSSTPTPDLGPEVNVERDENSPVPPKLEPAKAEESPGSEDVVKRKRTDTQSPS